MRSHIFRVVALCVYIGVLFFLFLYDFADSDNEIPNFILGIPTDKITHFSLFMFFALLCSATFAPKMRSGRAFLVILVSGVLLALATEFSQLLLTQYRSFEYWDLCADICGVLFGAIVSGVVKYYRTSQIRR